MRRSLITATAAALMLAPSAAVADRGHGYHGHGYHGHAISSHGPTFVYDHAYAAIHTRVLAKSQHGRTTVRLTVTGLPPHRTFGAHVHVSRCGPDPNASGGHYQHPGLDPRLPISAREVWLDISSNKGGRGRAVAHVPWVFKKGSAGSVVIHALPTDPGSGSAGDRLACTNVSLRR